MIKSFKHRGLKRLYERGDVSKLRPDIAGKARRVLFVLDNAITPEELDLPGFRLHRLSGNFYGYWSISVSRNHRIIFRFEAGDAYDLDVVDYH